MRHTGDHIAVSRYTFDNFFHDSALARLSLGNAAFGAAFLDIFDGGLLDRFIGHAFSGRLFRHMHSAARKQRAACGSRG